MVIDNYIIIKIYNKFIEIILKKKESIIYSFMCEIMCYYHLRIFYIYINSYNIVLSCLNIK